MHQFPEEELPQHPEPHLELAAPVHRVQQLAEARLQAADQLQEVYPEAQEHQLHARVILHQAEAQLAVHQAVRHTTEVPEAAIIEARQAAATMAEAEVHLAVDIAEAATVVAVVVHQEHVDKFKI